MKLIYCLECSDIVRLKKTKKYCDCGKIWGQYTDNFNAIISDKAILIGFSNLSFLEALKTKPKTEKGTKFEAFVISKNAISTKIDKD